MEKMLPASENFYRKIFENTRTATVILEEDDTILLVNGAFEKLAGYTREEIEGKKKWMEFVHRKDDLERMGKNQRLRRIDPLSVPDTYEFQFVDREGRVKDIVLNVTPIPDAKQVLTTLFDISERKRMESVLAESERRLADIIDFLPDATLAIDLSGKIIAWNRAMEELSGVKAEDMLGKCDYEYAIPFYGTRRPALVDLALEINEEIEEKYDFVKREGDVLVAEAELTIRGVHYDLWGKARPLYDSHGSIVGAIESFRDITELKNSEKTLQKAHDELEMRVRERTAKLMETNKTLQLEISDRKRIEGELTESERRLADIIDFLPDPTYAIDLSGKVIVWNHAIEEMTGVKAEDMLGKGDHEYIIPFYGTRRTVLIDLALRFDEELEKKYDFVKREGDVLLAEADVPVRGVPHTLWGKARPLYDSYGNIVGAIESVRDITERKRMEVALKAEISERIGIEKERERLIIELKSRTKNLQEVNTALNIVLQKREKDKNILEERFVANIGSLILPYVEKIRKNNIDEQQQLCLDIIEQNLNEIVNPLLKNIQQFNLTPREIQIASLIKDGKTTKEIAETLGIGKGSIDTHRKNIRKKIGLDRSSNLQSKLRFLGK